MDLVVYKQKKKEVVINQIEKINTTITKIKTKLFIATAAYDKFYKLYNLITITLFILSSVVTFIEALRLIIIEYVNKGDHLLITPTEKKNETKLFIFIYLKTMF
jgi:hypothetical protein